MLLSESESHSPFDETVLISQKSQAVEEVHVAFYSKHSGDIHEH